MKMMPLWPVLSCFWLIRAELELARFQDESCSECQENLDSFELEESELATLHLLQMQKILHQELENRSDGVAHVAENLTAATAGNSTGVLKPRLVSKPLGQYTKFVHAPDMHWAILSISFAVFVISGSLALAFWFLCRVRHKEQPSVTFKVAVVSFLAVIVAGAFWLAVWYFAGAVLKKWLMDYDTAFLGVDVTVDGVALNPWFGTLQVKNLTIGNPPGYGSEHLAHVGRLFVDVDMGGLVRSLGHRLTLDKVQVKNVDVIYERALTTSNIEDVLKHLGVLRSGEEPARPGFSTPNWQLDFRLRQVNTSDVWVHAAIYPMTSGVSMSVPNLAWKNFDEEVMPRSNDEGIVIVMATLLENAQRVLRF